MDIIVRFDNDVYCQVLLFKFTNTKCADGFNALSIRNGKGK